MLASIDLDASAITAIAALLAGVSVGALLKVVSRFLKHIEDKDATFTTFLGNHMSNTTKALENLTAVSRQMADKMDVLHEDNTETAAALREADKSITRLVEVASPPAPRKRAAKVAG